MAATSTSTVPPSNEKAVSVSSAGRSSKSSLRNSLRSIISKRSSKTVQSSTGPIPKYSIQDPEVVGVAREDDEKTLVGDTEPDEVGAVTVDIGRLKLDEDEDQEVEDPALEAPGLSPVSLGDSGLASMAASPRYAADVSCPLDLEELEAQLVRDVRAHRRRARAARAKVKTRPAIAVTVPPARTPKAKKIGKALLSFFCVSANPDDDRDTPARPAQRARRPPRAAPRAEGRHASASRTHEEGTRKRRRRKKGIQPQPSSTRTMYVPQNIGEYPARTTQGSHRLSRSRRPSNTTTRPNHQPRVNSAVSVQQARPRNPIALETHSSRRPNPKLYRKTAGHARGNEWVKAYLPPPREPGRRSRRSEGERRKPDSGAGCSQSAARRTTTHEPRSSHPEAR